MTFDRATMEAVHELRHNKRNSRPPQHATRAHGVVSTDAPALPYQQDQRENARTHSMKQIKWPGFGYSKLDSTDGECAAMGRLSPPILTQPEL
jgi:hypothetical protein